MKCAGTVSLGPFRSGGVLVTVHAGGGRWLLMGFSIAVVSIGCAAATGGGTTTTELKNSADA